MDSTCNKESQLFEASNKHYATVQVYMAVSEAMRYINVRYMNLAKSNNNNDTDNKLSNMLTAVNKVGEMLYENPESLIYATMYYDLFEKDIIDIAQKYPLAIGLMMDYKNPSSNRRPNDLLIRSYDQRYLYSTYPAWFH